MFEYVFYRILDSISCLVVRDNINDLLHFNDEYMNLNSDLTPSNKYIKVKCIEVSRGRRQVHKLLSI